MTTSKHLYLIGLRIFSLLNRDEPELSGIDNNSDIRLRVPTAEDGPLLHQLVAQCPPLDPNSIYCNLLHCSHFASTAVAAQLGDALVGFVSGYRIPERPDIYFLWQVAVGVGGRGQGLASRMIRHILERPALGDVAYLETTITPDNTASWRLFRGLARDLETEIEESIIFKRDTHFYGAHADEHLLRIGPFNLDNSGSQQ